MSNFCEGVTILLDRMDKFPEEFLYDPNDCDWPDLWAVVIRDIHDRQICDRLNEDYEERDVSHMVQGLTKEEHAALYRKLCDVERNHFTQYVVERVLGAKKRSRR